MVAAASFDDVLAITGFAVASGLAIPRGNLAASVAHGPLEVMLGVVAGLLGGLVASCTKLWNACAKRTAVLFLTSRSGWDWVLGLGRA